MAFLPTLPPQEPPMRTHLPPPPPERPLQGTDASELSPWAWLPVAGHHVCPMATTCACFLGSWPHCPGQGHPELISQRDGPRPCSPFPGTGSQVLGKVPRYGPPRTQAGESLSHPRLLFSTQPGATLHRPPPPLHQFPLSSRDTLQIYWDDPGLQNKGVNGT